MHTIVFGESIVWETFTRYDGFSVKVVYCFHSGNIKGMVS